MKILKNNQEVLDKMHAPPKVVFFINTIEAKSFQFIKNLLIKAADVPVITTADMSRADGFLFGIPTRFGMVPAQVKAFFDACGQLWMTGAL